jgi:hypothetical protein
MRDGSEWSEPATPTSSAATHSLRYISRRQLSFFWIHSQPPRCTNSGRWLARALIMARVLGTCSLSSAARRLQINSCWKLLSCVQHPLKKYINAPKAEGDCREIQPLHKSRVLGKFFARKKWRCMALWSGLILEANKK